MVKEDISNYFKIYVLKGFIGWSKSKRGLWVKDNYFIMLGVVRIIVKKII